MKERSFLNWARQHALYEAYLFYYMTVPPWPSGLQEIEIRIWWSTDLNTEAKIRIRISGFIDEWLKHGQLEKIKYQTLSQNFCEEFRLLLFQSDFWKQQAGSDKEPLWHKGEQSEMEGWKQKGGKTPEFRKYLFAPLERDNALYALQNKLFDLVPKELR
ncbi:MAG: hypothetical protein AB7I41_25330 [Candidatus Sericytochromatia bacterium]